MNPPIDPEAIRTLRELAPDDPAFLRELIDIFLDDMPSRIREIERARDTGNAELLTRAAHSIKGSAGNFGATALTSLALELEECGRNGDFTKASAHLSVMRQEYDRVAEALRQHR